MNVKRYDLSWVRKKTTIEAVAHLDIGWRLATKTHCFSETDEVGFVGDWRIRVQSSVFPRPSCTSKELKQFPSGKHGAGFYLDDSKSCSYNLENHRLEIWLPLLVGEMALNPALPWVTTQNNKLCVHWVEDFIAMEGPHSFELNVLAVIQAPPRTPIPPIKDWDSEFLSGGRPESNRRKF